MISLSKLARSLTREAYATVDRLRSLHPKVIATRTKKIMPNPTNGGWVCRNAPDLVYKHLTTLAGDLARYNLCYQYARVDEAGTLSIGHVHSLEEIILAIHNDPQVIILHSMQSEYSTQEWELVVRLHKYLGKSQRLRDTSLYSDEIEIDPIEKFQSDQPILNLDEVPLVVPQPQRHKDIRKLSPKLKAATITDIFAQIANEIEEGPHARINSLAQKFCDDVVDAMTEE